MFQTVAICELSQAHRGLRYWSRNDESAGADERADDIKIDSQF